MVGEECCVLLEAWQGDFFLGEAVLHLGGGDQRLLLQPAHTAARGMRPDGRKQAARHAGCVVSLDVGWTLGGAGRPALLRLTLRHAEGLPAALLTGETATPRVLLWLRQGAAAKFSPLWASKDAGYREVQGADTIAVWDEEVELALSAASAAAAAATLGASGATTGSSPFSASSTVARASPRNVASTTGSLANTTPRLPVELAASVRTPQEHVCGAEFEAHWGISSADGTMRGSVLASQVSHRLLTDRLHRSALLSQLAVQVEQSHELQLGWEAEVGEARQRLQANGEDMRISDGHAAKIREEIAAVVSEHETIIVQTSKDMCSVVDEHRIQEQSDEAALTQSRARIAEQRTMVHQMVDRSHALQGSLDRTVRKFDEVSSSYAQVQGDLMRSQVLRPREDPQGLANTNLGRALDASMGQAREVTADIDREERNLGALKSKLGTLQEELACERELSLRLEDFVRRIAAAPPARLRTGGGYQLDSTAKCEAAALLREIEITEGR